MPDEVGTSVVHRILRSCTRGRLAVAVACVAIATIGVFSVAAPHRQAAADPDRTTEQPPAAAGDASVLGSLGLLPRFDARDGETLAAIAKYAEIASRPTQTPQPSATPTLAPPTATPRPQPSPTPPARSAPTEAPPAVAPPTVGPPAVVPPTSTPVPPPPPAQAQLAGLDTSPMDAASQKLFDDTNHRRVSSGLAPLRANGYLVGIARIRSQDMAGHNYFAHVSPITGDNAFGLMDKHDVPYGWAGENLAKNNYPDSEAVGVADVALWNSPPHRENILNPNYTDMGIALVTDANGMKYFTIIFTGPA
jgi:uncharacterized protein YkwD